jgi:hypothetical protein
MSLKMGYVTRGQSSDHSRPYRKCDNPAENTIMVVFPGYSMVVDIPLRVSLEPSDSQDSVTDSQVPFHGLTDGLCITDLRPPINLIMYCNVIHST